MTAVTTVIMVTADSINFLFDPLGDGATLVYPKTIAENDENGPVQGDDTLTLPVTVDLERFYIDTFTSDERFDGFSRPEGLPDRVRLVPRMQVTEPPRSM